MTGRRPTPGPRGALKRAPLWLAAAIAAAIAVAGCGGSDGSDETAAPAGPSAPLSVVVEPGQASPGDEIAARVINEGEREYAYGAGYELERKEGSGWKRVKLPPRPVIEIAYIAQPGSSGPPVTVTVPKDAAPGDWRIVIDRNAPATGLLAGGFEVVRG